MVATVLETDPTGLPGGPAAFVAFAPPYRSMPSLDGLGLGRLIASAMMSAMASQIVRAIASRSSDLPGG